MWEGVRGMEGGRRDVGGSEGDAGGRMEGGRRDVGGMEEGPRKEGGGMWQGRRRRDEGGREEGCGRERWGCRREGGCRRERCGREGGRDGGGTEDWMIEVGRGGRKGGRGWRVIEEGGRERERKEGWKEGRRDEEHYMVYICGAEMIRSPTRMMSHRDRAWFAPNPFLL